MAGRRSNIKQTINGVPIRTYIMKELVNHTYRELVKDELFVKRTGIRSLGNLRNQCKKLDISMMTVYQYGQSEGLIRFSETFNDWHERTRGKVGVQKREIQKIELYREIGNSIGIDISLGMEESIAEMILKDFMSENDFLKRLEMARKRLSE